MQQLDTKQFLALLLICGLYISLSQFYQTSIPFSKGPDELTHYLYARFISEHGRLPITPLERATTSTRAYLPPLYHMAVAVGMSISYSPQEVVLKESWQPPTRQLIDIVLPRATLIRTEDERWPYHGEYLAWVVGRWVSTLLTTGTIILTFLISRSLLPHRPYLALAATALVAFNPMVLFISAVLNDDNMVGLTMAGYLLLFVWFLRGQDNIWLYIGMGILIGLGVTTKYNTGLIALSTAFIIMTVRSTRGWTWPATLKRIGLVWLMVLITSSWWFVWSEVYFNEVAEYGLTAGLLKPFVPDVDPTANRIVDFFANEAIDPGLPSIGIQGNFSDWLWRTFETSWALTVYGVPPYPFYWPVITYVAGLVLLSLAGLWFTFRQGDPFQRTWLLVFGLHFITILPLPLIRFFMTYRINDTAQGRHLFFPAAPVIAILLLTGWDYWLKPNYQKIIGSIGICGLLLWAILHGCYLSTAYPPPLPVRTTVSPKMVMAHTAELNFAELVLLTGYQTKLLEHDKLLEVELRWQSLVQAKEDYRTELFLIDSQNKTQLHWLSQPANGRFPVRAWQPGDIVRDTLYLPLAGLSADTYKLQLRLLGWSSPLSTTKQAERITLTTVTLDSSIPHQKEINLRQDQDLTGFESLLGLDNIPTYRYRATIPVTLSQPKELFLLDPHGHPHRPTTKTDFLQTFMVDYDWPSGKYQLQVDGEMSDIALLVENFDRRRNGWNFNPPAISHIVQANFADKITLLGYDLPIRKVKAGDGIPLVLYWRGLKQMRDDYTISVQLLDADLQRRGGYDRFPRENYNSYLWVPGEIVDDGFAVPVDNNAPDGIYTIRIGLYHQQDEQVTTLPLMQDGQSLIENSVTIGPIKVGDAPPGIVAKEIAPEHPEHPMNVLLSDIIMLRGYDLQQEGNTLHLRLYWQSRNQTEIDYTTFVHLRNQAGEVIAQKDQPPTAGAYPTSLWEIGEIALDEIILDNLPAGEYQLVVGLYDFQSGTRLSVANSLDGSVILMDKLEIGN